MYFNISSLNIFLVFNIFLLFKSYHPFNWWLPTAFQRTIWITWVVALWTEISILTLQLFSIRKFPPPLTHPVLLIRLIFLISLLFLYWTRHLLLRTRNTLFSWWAILIIWLSGLLHGGFHRWLPWRLLVIYL